MAGQKGSEVVSVPDQLLILGNGFDLQCGLASAFSHFEKLRKDTINTILKAYAQDDEVGGSPMLLDNDEKLPSLSLVADFKDKGITAWDFILIFDEQVRTWYDVEACIREWLMGHEEDDQALNENQLQAVKNQYLKVYK